VSALDAGLRLLLWLLYCQAWGGQRIIDLFAVIGRMMRLPDGHARP
jgi:hypothetical protein